MKKVLFERKAYKEQLVPQDDYTIEKVLEIDNDEFNNFLDDMLADKDFIDVNKDLMYVDKDNVWHAILVTSKEADFGILIQSEGYPYARYSAYIHKNDLGDYINE